MSAEKLCNHGIVKSGKDTFSAFFSDTGNEELLEGIKITSDHLMVSAEVLQFEFINELTFSDPYYVPGYILCKEQCALR